MNTLSPNIRSLFWEDDYTHEKWAAVFERRQLGFYKAYLKEPQWENVTALRWSRIKAEQELHQLHEHIADELAGIPYAVDNLPVAERNTGGIIDNIGTDHIYRLVFCIAASRFLHSVQNGAPDDLLSSAWKSVAGDDASLSLIKATVLFTSELFAPYCDCLINALEINNSGGVDLENFESAFLFFSADA